MNASARPSLNHTFAQRLPELARAAHAADFPALDIKVLNESLAVSLGLDVEWLRSDGGTRWLAGVDGGSATAYAGHQFGQFVPLLGDGRALLLGDLTSDPQGREIQVKGSGPTPFSRPGSDGFGAVGPMLREYLVSEFMHAVGIPTTRALAVLTTGNKVLRQQGVVPGGIVVRVASSHLRVGTVQFAATQSGELVEKVVAAAGFASPAALLETVMHRQVSLVAKWMRIGFVHGVMNTDNTTLSGETIDYGPCAFTPVFQADARYSSIDEAGRYAFGNQPPIIAWNLARLAEALLCVMEADTATRILAPIQQVWEQHWGREVPDPQSLAHAADITVYNRENHGGPIFIPRNYMLQKAITSAERDGNYLPYNELLAAVTDPFNPNAGKDWMSAPETAQRAGEDKRPFVTYCGT
ncbi:protein adenylyltransferase SelO family protein [Corynebacterium mayonis]|uniref:protein adenylyltransferase SelO family protein n=1 Tax=Corynebacterium mayonis TaxID=3062461 RepID=UPI00313FEDF1